MAAVKFTDLEAIELLALSKLELKDGVRKKLLPGDYEVDFIVHVQGTVGVGADYEGTVSAAVPWRDMFLAALSRLPAPQRAEFVADYLRASVTGTPAIVNPEAICAEVEAMVKSIVGTTKRVCSGKTSAALIVGAVEGVVR